MIKTTSGPRGYGIWGEKLFIFRELGSNGNYFQDVGSKLIVWGIYGAQQKSKKKSHLKGNAFISFDFLKKNLRLPQTPLGKSNIFTFVLTC